MSPKRPSRSDLTSSGGDALQAAPAWFEEFLIDRSTRKPSPHTIAAYRQDFSSIATLITDGRPAELSLTDITRDSMRSAFGAYATGVSPLGWWGFGPEVDRVRAVPGVSLRASGWAIA